MGIWVYWTFWITGRWISCACMGEDTQLNCTAISILTLNIILAMLAVKIHDGYVPCGWQLPQQMRRARVTASISTIMPAYIWPIFLDRIYHCNKRFCNPLRLRVVMQQLKLLLRAGKFTLGHRS